MICVGCKYAEWLRTKTGALHPSGQGTCGYRLVVKLPGAYSLVGDQSSVALGYGRPNKSLTVEGGRIDRSKNHEYPTACDVKAVA